MIATIASFATLFAQTNDSMSVGAVFGASLFGMFIGGLVGYFIGKSKNRVGLGVILGALLGCLGWIIMLIVPRKDLY